MLRILIVKRGQQLCELGENLIMPGHVRGQDTPDDSFANGSILGSWHTGKNGTFRSGEEPKRHAAMVVLKGRDIIVPANRQTHPIDQLSGIDKKSIPQIGNRSKIAIPLVNNKKVFLIF